MDSNSDANVARNSDAARAAVDALVHEYGRSYIASSPRRMEQLLAAYRSSSEAGGQPSYEFDDEPS